MVILLSENAPYKKKQTWLECMSGAKLSIKKSNILVCIENEGLQPITSIVFNLPVLLSID